MAPKDHFLKWTHRKILEIIEQLLTQHNPAFQFLCVLKEGTLGVKERETFVEYLQGEICWPVQSGIDWGLAGCQAPFRCFVCIIYWPNPQTAPCKKNYSYHPILQIRKLPWLSHPANVCGWIHLGCLAILPIGNLYFCSMKWVVLLKIYTWENWS